MVSKKNKDIEIRVEASEKTINGSQVTVNQLFIGKKQIGEVVEKGLKSFDYEMSGGFKGSVKTFDEAVELIIRQWNLQE